MSPQRTHALVVGIERYAAGWTWALKGPAADARRFADWLLSRHVPEEQVTLLVAPLDESSTVTEERPRALPASRNRLRQALSDLHNQAGDLLLIFWSGHGILGADKSRRLFYPEATTDDKQNLDLDDLLASLRSTYFSGFPRQICIIDACANYAEDMQLAYQLPKETLPSGSPFFPEPAQFVLLAGRAGEVARNLGEEGRGQFSKVVLDELAGETAWPPDLEVISRRVQQRFSALRAEDRTHQTPIYWWHRAWDGSIEQGMSPAATARAMSPSNARWKLSHPNLTCLVDALLACPSLKDPGRRQTVVDQLGDDISASIARDAAERFDVFNIVTTCANYPGGLKWLLEVLHFFEGDSLSWRAANEILSDLSRV